MIETRVQRVHKLKNGSTCHEIIILMITELGFTSMLPSVETNSHRLLITLHLVRGVIMWWRP